MRVSIGHRRSRFWRMRMKVRLESVNPSLLNFLSGVTATIAITIALSPFAMTNSGHAVWRPYVLAMPWGFSAVFWALAATLLQDARHNADLVITSNLTEDEKLDLYTSSIDSVRTLSRILIVAAVLFILLGFAIEWLPI